MVQSNEPVTISEIRWKIVYKYTPDFGTVDLECCLDLCIMTKLRALCLSGNSFTPQEEKYEWLESYNTGSPSTQVLAGG